MSNEQIQAQAEAYAKATTHARCAKTGDCDKCNLRYCDYKSRIDAYLRGWADCLQAFAKEEDEEMKRFFQGFSYKQD